MLFNNLEDLVRTFNLSKPNTVAGTIQEILQDAILKGLLKAGEALPTEELATLFKVSRMPIREALRALAARGLVMMAPYKGARVAKVSACEVSELAVVRTEIEKIALRYAIPMSRERLTILKKNLSQLIKSETDFGSALELNDDFHNGLYEDVDNQILIELVKDFRRRMDRYIRIFTGVLGSTDQIAEEHWMIIDGCEAVDVEKATKALDVHITGVKNRLVDYLKSRGLD